MTIFICVCDIYISVWNLLGLGKKVEKNMSKTIAKPYRLGGDFGHVAFFAVFQFVCTFQIVCLLSICVYYIVLYLYIGALFVYCLLWFTAGAEKRAHPYIYIYTYIV